MVDSKNKDEADAWYLRGEAEKRMREYLTKGDSGLEGLEAEVGEWFVEQSKSRNRLAEEVRAEIGETDSKLVGTCA